MKAPKTIELTVEKLVLGGQGLARQNDKTYLIWNALPGETVNALILSKRGGIFDCMAVQVLKPSPERIKAAEKHSLSCSPWQILSFDSEIEWKKKIALEAYRHIGKLDVESLEILSDQHFFGYRNKMEYSFVSDNGLSLAFFERSSHHRAPIAPCLLARPEINETAVKVLDWLKKEKYPEPCLKNLIVRSGEDKKTVAALLIQEDLAITASPELDEHFTGFEIYYSNPKSPAAVPHKKILSRGSLMLNWKLLSADFRFGAFSFFQINPPVFQMALEAMLPFTNPEDDIVDFYGGVGAIGLSLHGRYRSSLIIDSSADAITCAKENIEWNQFSNCKAVLAPSEKMISEITKDRLVILDPPRAGLHEDVVKKILLEKPSRVIYLSCNPATHARDLKLLTQGYSLKLLKLFNFFPRTPHIEALAVLDHLS